MIYQIQRQINTITQGNFNITQYYSKLKRLWEEFACLEPIPACTCRSAKAIGDIVEYHKLMKFLMGLREDYDNSKDQILLTEPLLLISKVYSMMLKVEKQIATHDEYRKFRSHSVHGKILDLQQRKWTRRKRHSLNKTWI